MVQESMPPIANLRDNVIETGDSTHDLVAKYISKTALESRHLQAISHFLVESANLVFFNHIPSE